MFLFEVLNFTALLLPRYFKVFFLNMETFIIRSFFSGLSNSLKAEVFSFVMTMLKTDSITAYS